jgi:catechol 2,3-dioxygenase-like lactoylglutathione lyase family enzyme
MPIRNISHIAVGVSDMDRALEFYLGVLGNEISCEKVEEFQLNGRPHKRRAIYIRWSDDPHAPFIVLDHQMLSDDKTAPKQIFERGIHHFGFWADDVDAIAERARAAGVEFIREPTDTDTIWYGEPEGNTVRYLLMRDPDGNVVQVEQRIS